MMSDSRPSSNGIKDVPFIMTVGTDREVKARHPTQFEFKADGRGQFTPQLKPRQVKAEERTMNDLAESLRTTKLEKENPSMIASNEVKVPRFVELDGVKLTFKMYFQESVPESNLERSRYRYVVLRYFLLDDSVEIMEPEVKNSGLPAGKFLKRMQHPSVTPDVLRVGEDLTIYGRCFHIMSCDDYTRKFYEKNGMPQLPNEGALEDNFTRSQNKIIQNNPDAYFGRQKNALSQYVESIMGKEAVKRSVHVNPEFEGKVLCFHGIWDDTSKLGMAHHYVITYHLDDNEIHISEKATRNDLQFPVMVKKQVIPRKLKIENPCSGADNKLGEDDILNWRDFVVGQYVEVFSRNILICDCDDYTQEFYEKHLGIDQKANAIEMEPAAKPPKAVTPPPPTGFGSEEDSLQSWRHLIPQKPRRDPTSLPSPQEKALKYTAKLVTKRDSEKGRMFRISWYLDTGTMSIYEPVQRNSGVVGGAFQKRQKTINEKTGEYVKLEELYVGATLVIRSHLFEITDVDEASLKRAEQDGNNSTPLAFVMVNLKKKLHDQPVSLRRMFRMFDTDHSQTISLPEFKKIITYYGMSVNTDDLVTLFRAFDGNGDGMITYQDFNEVFTDDHVNDTGSVLEKMDRALDRGRQMTPEEKHEYHERAEEAAKRQSQESYVQKLMSTVARAFRNSKAATVLYQKFREFDANKDHQVDRNEFRMALGASEIHGMFNFSDHDIDLLENVFFDEGSDTIQYDEFMTKMSKHADSIVRTQ